MRLYKVTYTPFSVELGRHTQVTNWFGSERDATRHRMLLLHDGKIRNRKDATLNMVEVPTSKQALIDWLNNNCV